ncbi:hypothetical protein [Nonomuraea sp. NPDC049709]|uniref:hypothetical protein n=1 Tax=Nonomuraea sp. NPDC049709 TaxID=3154736 RepID=UPI003443467C
MKHRGTMILLALGVAVAGVMSMGLVRAAGQNPDLGEPVVVSPSPSSPASAVPSGRAGEPTSKAGSPTGSPGAEPGGSAEPGASERPTSRKSKAEPVEPPSPRPGGGGDDDDDDGGGDDDGDD